MMQTIFGYLAEHGGEVTLAREAATRSATPRGPSRPASSTFPKSASSTASSRCRACCTTSASRYSARRPARCWFPAAGSARRSRRSWRASTSRRRRCRSESSICPAATSRRRSSGRRWRSIPRCSSSMSRRAASTCETKVEVYRDHQGSRRARHRRHRRLLGDARAAPLRDAHRLPARRCRVQGRIRRRTCCRTKNWSPRFSARREETHEVPVGCRVTRRFS